jgi:hypothetical protein
MPKYISLARLRQWQQFHDQLGDIRDRARKIGMDAELGDLGASLYFKKPKDHLRMGTGKRHIVLNVGVHPNEPLGANTALWIAEMLADNKEFLDAQDLTVDVICSDPDGWIWNDTWIGEENLPYSTYVYNHLRLQHSSDEVWNFQRSGAQDLALQQLVHSWPLGHEAILYASLHSSPLYTGAWAHADGPNIKRWIAPFENLANRTTGLIPDPMFADGAAWSDLLPGARAVFGLEKGDRAEEYLRKYLETDELGKPSFGMSDMEWMQLQFPNVTVLNIEAPMWSATKVPDLLKNATMDDVQRLAHERSERLDKVFLLCNMFAWDVYPISHLSMATRATSPVIDDFGLFAATRERASQQADAKPVDPRKVDSRTAFQVAYINGSLRTSRPAHTVQLMETMMDIPLEYRRLKAPRPKHRSLADFPNMVKAHRHWLTYGKNIDPSQLEFVDTQPRFLRLHRELVRNIDNIVDTTVKDGGVSEQVLAGSTLQAGGLVRGIENALDLPFGTLPTPRPVSVGLGAERSLALRA